MRERLFIDKPERRLASKPDAGDANELSRIKRSLEQGLALARKVGGAAVKIALYSQPGGAGLIALRNVAKMAGKQAVKEGVAKAVVDVSKSWATQDIIGGVGRIGTIDKSISEINIGELKSIKGLSEEKWKIGGIQERAASLNELEATLARKQGRPPVEIVFENMKKNEAGFFDGKKLHVNIEHIRNPGFRLEVIDTIAHEGCHAYQEWAIFHPGFHPNDAEVKYWAANRLAYFQPKYIGEKFGPEYYRNQPMELHAWSYGRKIQDVYKSPFSEFESMLPEYLRNGIASLQKNHRELTVGERFGGIKDRIESYIHTQLEKPRVRNRIKSGLVKIAIKSIAKALKWWESNGASVDRAVATSVRSIGRNVIRHGGKLA